MLSEGGQGGYDQGDQDQGGYGQSNQGGYGQSDQGGYGQSNQGGYGQSNQGGRGQSNQGYGGKLSCVLSLYHSQHLALQETRKKASMVTISQAAAMVLNQGLTVGDFLS